jgi:hypothetical protein
MIDIVYYMGGAVAVNAVRSSWRRFPARADDRGHVFGIATRECRLGHPSVALCSINADTMARD